MIQSSPRYLKYIFIYIIFEGLLQILLGAVLVQSVYLVLAFRMTIVLIVTAVYTRDTNTELPLSMGALLAFSSLVTVTSLQLVLYKAGVPVPVVTTFLENISKHPVGTQIAFIFTWFLLNMLGPYIQFAIASWLCSLIFIRKAED